MAPIADAGQIALLIPDSDEAKWFGNQLKVLKKSQSQCEKSVAANEHWSDKLSPEETTQALE